MNHNTFEECLVGSCAPTLAGVKAGNLFTFAVDARQMHALLHTWNQRLSGKGVRLRALRQRDGRNLILVYRHSALQSILLKPEVALFLAEHGYAGRDPETCLQTLTDRIAAVAGFPHEIGVFLGYPLHDVQGFIVNKGENARCCGCWKVYDRQVEAECQFRRFHKCTCIYRKMFQNGKSIPQLTVAA